jgi:hypothetical protein
MSTNTGYRKKQEGLAYEATLKKIDSAPIDGLLGTPDSLAYKINELEKHFHNSDQVWGLTTNDMARKSLVPIVVTAGQTPAWGTELMLTDGTVIESGSATKKFDLSKIKITVVGTVNRNTILEFYSSPIGTPVACTFDFTAGAVEDMVVCAAHGLANGDKIVFKAGGGALPAELNDYTVYYVVNRAAGYFQVSYTVGGAAVEFTDDGGAAFWYPINTTTGVQKNTQTLFTEVLTSRIATSTDSYSVYVKSPRIPCNYRLFCRGIAAAGTNAISFFIILHTYNS